MKLIALAVLAGSALAEDPTPTAKAVGTPCTKSADCGDATTMCCGIGADGKMCKTEACTDTTSPVDVPNMMFCNNRASPTAFVLKQADVAGSNTLYA